LPACAAFLEWNESALRFPTVVAFVEKFSVRRQKASAATCADCGSQVPLPRPTAMPDVDALAKSPDEGVTPPPMAPATPPAVARAVVAPLAAQRYKLQLTIGRETHDKLHVYAVA
jgi:hypothetical protein